MSSMTSYYDKGTIIVIELFAFAIRNNILVVWVNSQTT